VTYRDTEADPVTQVVDYVSGMTDRFALAMHDRLFDADAGRRMTPLLRDPPDRTAAR
jgi:dGTPase